MRLGDAGRREPDADADVFGRVEGALGPEDDRRPNKARVEYHELTLAPATARSSR